MYKKSLGPLPQADGTLLFRVWAPNAQEVALHLLRQDTYTPMQRDEAGYFTCQVTDAKPGDRYFYRLDDEKERPDPASRAQPDGVHGASQIVDSHFDWQANAWVPPTLRNSVMLELHVGTFTPEGTFDAIILHLDRLQTLGITTLQLMPIAAFPGERNWGYDGVSLFAAHQVYGGADGLKRLVDAAHQRGMAVMLDAVYNHLGPEGNYLWDYGPYFTDKYHGPWGDSLNFDGTMSDAVRNFFIQSALYWLDVCRVDGLRLDATHALFDFSSYTFLEELAETVDHWAEANNRHVHLIAENDQSNARLTQPREANGIGIDGQWLDDLHHVLHVALTGEDAGYYADYTTFDTLTKVLREGFALTGQYSHVHKRRHGTDSSKLSTERFVVASQTHDQVGNRMLGERLTALIDFDGLKLAAAMMTCSPYVPMLFMGEAYGETAPFLYFVSHGDKNLIEAVRQGRIDEFSAFAWKGTPPDPQAVATYKRSKLNHDLRHDGHHAILYRLYGELLRIRRENPAMTNPRRAEQQVHSDNTARIVAMTRTDGANRVRIVMNFNLDAPATLTLPGGNDWQCVLDSQAATWRTDTNDGNRPAQTFKASDAHHSITLAPKAFAIYTTPVEG
jgi:maltooligosyltrehalose trehalohydrolase